MKNKLSVTFKPTDIVKSQRIGKKPISQAIDKRSLLVKLSGNELKNDLLAACRAVKPNNFYISENIIRKRSTILYKIRQAKKKFPKIISGCNTINMKVYAWIKPPNPSAPNARDFRMAINSEEKFSEFCRNVLNTSPSSFVSNNNNGSSAGNQ